MQNLDNTELRKSVQNGARSSVLFGGVRFELLANFEHLALLDEHALFVETRMDAPVFADVSVALEGVARRRGPFEREIERVWDGDEARFSVGSVRGQMTEVTQGRFVARAEVSPDDVGVSSFVSAATSIVVERLGGAILHATAVVLEDGRAILFIGPSGAGKTTTAHHCPGTTWLARDRAAIVPHAGRYAAFGMPGGDPIALPRTDRAVARLAGICRIKRAEDASRIDRLDTLDALATLRENTFAGGDAEAEAARLETLLRLAEIVPVVDLSVRLGDDLTQQISEAFP